MIVAHHLDSIIGNLRAQEGDIADEKLISDVDLKRKGFALKTILLHHKSEDEDLKEEDRSLDKYEAALLSQKIRRVIQSKTQRYGKGFLKSNNMNKSFKNS